MHDSCGEGSGSGGRGAVRDGDLARVTCPIGVPGVAGKQPGVIAVAVLAQMLALPLAPMQPSD